MLRVLLPIIFVAVAGDLQNDPATRQLAHFKNKTMHSIGVLTTDTGAPVEYREATDTINSDFLDNEYLVETYQHVLRKTIPERVTHASGAGAFGYLEITHDISHITKAAIFNKIGKRTPAAVRFSPAFSSIGARDTVREPRGFACKLYSEEGNYDITTINFPMFAFKEVTMFLSLLNVFQGNPATNLPDHNMIWDFLVQQPMAFNEFIRLLSYKGLPYGYPHMEGFSVHTMQFYNATGSIHFGRWYWSPCAGQKYFNRSEVAELPSGDSNFFARDLYNKIAYGKYPTWVLNLQIVPEKDVKKYELDIFDPTMDLPFDKYPPHPVGRLVLNENPTNHFSQIEVLAFSPGNIVPGVCGAPDSLFQARRFAYRDTQVGRMGINYKRIPVNSPLRAKTHNYNRNGLPPLNDNGRDGPNYYPNTFNGPEPYRDDRKPSLIKIRQTAEVRNYKQAAEFYSSLTSEQKTEVVDNIVEHMCSCEMHIKKGAVKLMKHIHNDLGTRVAKELAEKCAYEC